MSGRRVHRLAGSKSIGQKLDVYAVAATYSDRREISLAKRLFRLRTGKFRWRSVFVSPSSSQAIETVGARNFPFRGFVQFQGFAPNFFALLFAVRFPIRPSRPSFNLVSQNSSIARIRFQGKQKGEFRACAFVRFHRIDRLV
jgi:hypothetical protein